MAMGSWVGPVFAYEWRTASRRWQGYALRGHQPLIGEDRPYPATHRHQLGLPHPRNKRLPTDSEAGPRP